MGLRQELVPDGIVLALAGFGRRDENLQFAAIGSSREWAASLGLTIH
jgi:hypothetical protein